jgi:hypothetical protein
MCMHCTCSELWLASVMSLPKGQGSRMKTSHARPRQLPGYTITTDALLRGVATCRRQTGSPSTVPCICPAMPCLALRVHVTQGKDASTPQLTEIFFSFPVPYACGRDRLRSEHTGETPSTDAYEYIETYKRTYEAFVRQMQPAPCFCVYFVLTSLARGPSIFHAVYMG